MPAVWRLPNQADSQFTLLICIRKKRAAPRKTVRRSCDFFGGEREP